MSHSLFAMWNLCRNLCALLIIAPASSTASFAADPHVTLHDAPECISLVGRVLLFIDVAHNGTETVARVGGDEFVILFGNMPDRGALEAIAERVLAAVTEPVEHAGQSFSVSGSLGIATVPGNGHSLADLMSAADSTMYGIKKSGRAAFAFHTEVHS